MQIELSGVGDSYCKYVHGGRVLELRDGENGSIYIRAYGDAHEVQVDAAELLRAVTALQP